MKTSELGDEALDWAVTAIENSQSLRFGVKGWLKQRRMKHWKAGGEHHYHRSWAQGGPIIQREKIDVWTHADKEWAASVDKGRNEFRGRTPLIAAMRCYVASKIGDEIEIPEELK